MMKRRMFQKLAAAAVAVLLVLGLVPGIPGFGIQTALAASGNWSDYVTMPSGTGADVDNPILIGSAEELAWFAQNVGSHSTAYVELTANINLADHYWVPIGTDFNSFKGYFNGNGYTISDMTISVAASYQGLFGYVGTGGTVERVALENPSITIADNFQLGFGGIAGGNKGTIYNCSVKGTGGITASSSYAGGIVGYNEGTIHHCVADVPVSTINAALGAGGVAGYSSGTVQNCLSLYAPASDDTQYLGAIVGRNSGTVSDNHYTYTTESGSATTIYAVGGTPSDMNNNSTLGDYSDYMGSSATDWQYDDAFFLDYTYWTITWDTGTDTSVWTTDGSQAPIYLQPKDSGGGDPETPTWADYADTDFDGGSGDADGDEGGGSPYEINTAAQLAYLAGQVNGGEDYDSAYFVLTDDIDLSDYEWIPIGDMYNNFAGHFDGDGYTISGMYIGTEEAPNDTVPYAALFANTDVQSEIHDVTLTNAGIYSTYAESAEFDGNYVGLLVGYVQGEVDKCSVSGTIICGDADNSSIHAGGLAGCSDGAVIHNSTADVAVKAGNGDAGIAVGGFIGSFFSGVAYDCASVGEVRIGTLTDTESFGMAGGFAGMTYGTIWNCSATGNVFGGDDTDLGGFVGYIGWGGEIDNCYARGNVLGYTGADVGGFVGNAYEGYIQNCYATGNTTGGSDSDVGGFNGDYDDASIWDCYFNTSATQYSGGVRNDPAVSDEGTGMAADAMQDDDFTETLNDNVDTIEPQNEEWADYMAFSGWTRDDGTNGGYPYFGEEPAASGVPTNVAVKAGNEQATLTWDAVDGADGYKVYYGTKTGTYSVSMDATFNSCTVGGLVNDTTYYFVVVAIKASVESAYSDEVKATTFHVSVLEDSASRKVIATDEITVIVNSNGSYQLQLNPGVSGFYPNAGFHGAYILFNKNDTVFRKFSELSSTISDFELSDNVISMIVTDSANQLEHTVSWEIIGTTSVSSGGYMKLSVTSRNTDTSAHNLGTYIYWDTQINGNDGSPFTIIPNGWTNYSGNFQISGYFRNEDGTTPADALFMGTYNNPSTLTWTRETRMTWAQHDAALGNTVTASDTAASAWYDPLSIAAGESRTVSCVFSVNSQTPRINPITAQPGTVNHSTTLQIGVEPQEGASFKYKIFNSVPPIPVYNAPASSVAGLTDITEGADITGVDPDTNRYIGIYEVDGAGNITRFAAKKLFASEILELTVPSAPTNVTATAGNKTATVSFTAPTDDGGSDITSYPVHVYIGGVLQGTLSASGTGSPITVSGLANGTAYTFKVVATNAQGDSAESEASVAVTPQSPSTGGSAKPYVATGSISNITLSSATLFGEVVSIGGSEIISRGFVIGKTPSSMLGDMDVVNIPVGTAANFTAVVTSLLPSTTYYVRAYAVNAAGISYGLSVSFTTGTTRVPLTGDNEIPFVGGAGLMILGSLGGWLLLRKRNAAR